MFEAPAAVATLRDSDTFQASYGYSKSADPRTNRCFEIRFEVLSGDAALAAFTDIEIENQDLLLGAEATASQFSYRGLEIIGDLSLVRETRLDKNSFVAIEMKIPGYWHSMRCVGSISWLHEDKNVGYFKAGVSFLNVKRQNLAFIQAAIDKFVAAESVRETVVSQELQAA